MRGRSGSMSHGVKSRSTRMAFALAAVAFGGAAALGGCAAQPAERAAESPGAPSPTPSAEPSPEPSTEPPVERTRVRTVATGLDAPWSIAFYGETPLVSQRDSARILELDESGKRRKVAVIDGVVPGGEAGLLGIAVRDAYLYAYFTARDDNRIERYAISGAPGSLKLGKGKRIISGIPAASNHDGGRIAFGPDGMLYATAGDASNTGNAQNRSSLAGKILRMTPGGKVPGDNPFPGSYVYSLGHRNPQGIAWAPDGTMYASEFGQDTWDELNVIRVGGNYGWPVVEGIAAKARYIDPVQQWAPAKASPSGIAILDGAIYI